MQNPSADAPWKSGNAARPSRRRCYAPVVASLRGLALSLQERSPRRVYPWAVEVYPAAAERVHRPLLRLPVTRQAKEAVKPLEEGVSPSPP